MKHQDLHRLWHAGVSALTRQDYALATEKLSELCRAHPGFEHGLAEFHLASALEEAGALPEAKMRYQQAMRHGPNDAVIVGGFASFLYLHGAAQEAFDLYRHLLAIEKAASGETADITQALLALGERMGMTRDEVLIRIETNDTTSSDASPD